ncbi:uncharacterized protein [Rutidosis leptorrhynchoides]|uniref:uncharacterized protein n=1 Tax=Rutidosis leptorrhynchoides TaxID=125765 RepID=UPI003A999FCE
MVEQPHRGAYRSVRFTDPDPYAEIERLKKHVADLELQNQQLYEDRASEILLKVEIPEFNGTAHPDEFLDWLSTVERVFDIKNIPERLKVKLVALKLKKHASLWWDHVKRQRALARKSKIETWDKMKKLMRDKFLPENHRQDAFIEYHNLQQRSMGVEEFIHEFDKLRMRCAVDEPEEQIIARFVGNLKPEIADVVTLQPYWTYIDVCRLALKVEKKLQRDKNRTPFIRNSTTPSAPFVDKSAGDISSSTPQITPTNKPPTCYKCQGKGHYARECPNKRSITIWDDEQTPQYDLEDD